LSEGGRQHPDYGQDDASHQEQRAALLPPVSFHSLLRVPDLMDFESEGVTAKKNALPVYCDQKDVVVLDYRCAPQKYAIVLLLAMHSRSGLIVLLS
jgi:hypothetical protein